MRERRDALRAGHPKSLRSTPTPPPNRTFVWGHGPPPDDDLERRVLGEGGFDMEVRRGMGGIDRLSEAKRRPRAARQPRIDLEAAGVRRFALDSGQVLLEVVIAMFLFCEYWFSYK